MVGEALELYPILHEGDQVVATMPSSIAYGEDNNKGLSGGSSLIFNPIIIKSVSEPKILLGDTLFMACQSGRIEDVLNL